MCALLISFSRTYKRITHQHIRRRVSIHSIMIGPLPKRKKRPKKEKTLKGLKRPKKKKTIIAAKGRKIQIRCPPN